MIKFGIQIVHSPNKKTVGKWIYETTDINNAHNYLDIACQNFPKNKYLIEEIKKSRR